MGSRSGLQLDRAGRQRRIHPRHKVHGLCPQGRHAIEQLLDRRSIGLEQLDLERMRLAGSPASVAVTAMRSGVMPRISSQRIGTATVTLGRQLGGTLASGGLAASGGVAASGRPASAGVGSQDRAVAPLLS